jgi:acetyl esterase
MEIPIPEALRRMMAEIGPIWAADVPRNVRRMIDAFDPVLARCPKDGVEVRRDIAYGPDPAHRLDLYLPRGASGAPAVVFVHGGAFVDGEKERSPQVYANVCFWFARHGVACVNMEYRLAPKAPYPSGTEDVAAACRWLVDHADAAGVDARRIVPFGHSAGAAHAASCAYGAPGAAGAPPLAGLIVVSGRVRADNRPDNPNARKVEAYYGTDASRYQERSAVGFADPRVPTFIGFAQYENPLLDCYCLELAHVLSVGRGAAPRVLQLPGHNHTSIIAHLNTAEDLLGRELLAFVERTHRAD